MICLQTKPHVKDTISNAFKLFPLLQDTCPLCHAGLVQTADRQHRSTNTDDDHFDQGDVIDNDRVIEDQGDDDDTDDLAMETDTSGDDDDAGGDSDLLYDSMEEYRRMAERHTETPDPVIGPSRRRTTRTRRSRPSAPPALRSPDQDGSHSDD